MRIDEKRLRRRLRYEAFKENAPPIALLILSVTTFYLIIRLAPIAALVIWGSLALASPFVWMETKKKVFESVTRKLHYTEPQGNFKKNESHQQLPITIHGAGNRVRRAMLVILNRDHPDLRFRYGIVIFNHWIPNDPIEKVKQNYRYVTLTPFQTSLVKWRENKDQAS